MGIAAHIARLRALVGHELLVLPSSAVLAVDEEGRVLLAWAAGGAAGTMIVVTFFVVLIPYRDSSPKLTRSFTELPRRAADGEPGVAGSVLA